MESAARSCRSMLAAKTSRRSATTWLILPRVRAYASPAAPRRPAHHDVGLERISARAATLPHRARGDAHGSRSPSQFRHTRVRATGPGRVVFAGSNGGYGRMVEIDHGNGITTAYGHLQLDLGRGRRHRRPRRRHRPLRQHRPQHGTAPALRGAAERPRHRSGAMGPDGAADSRTALGLP